MAWSSNLLLSALEGFVHRQVSSPRKRVGSVIPGSVGSTPTSSAMDEATFHRSRRMFVLLTAGLRLAPEDDPRSHTQWFMAEGWLPCLKQSPRGYWDERGVFIYKDIDFRPVSDEELYQVALQLKEYLPAETRVFTGMIPDDYVGKWKPRLECGTLMEWWQRG